MGPGLVGPAHQRHPGPLRALLGSGRTAGSTAHRARRAVPRGRYGSLTAATGRSGRPTASRSGPPTVGGRWSLLPAAEPDPTHRAHALARALLDRHGIVTRGAVAAEGVEGGFSAAYRVLAAFEESGQARRGYVVEGLGAAQFAMDGAVDRLRAVNTQRERTADDALPDTGPARSRRGGPQRAVVLAAADPANAYGAALSWPEPPEGSTHKPGRKAGSLVVLVDGELTLYLERGGKTLLIWPFGHDPAPAPTDARLQLAVEALTDAARAGALGTITTERINGTSALTSPTPPPWSPPASTRPRGACDCGVTAHRGRSPRLGRPPRAHPPARTHPPGMMVACPKVTPSGAWPSGSAKRSPAAR